MVRACLLLAALLVLDACAPAHAAAGADQQTFVTVRVENGTFYDLAIYQPPHTARLSTIESGRSGCVRLRGIVGDVVLVANPVGKRGVILSPPFSASEAGGWRWKIQTDALPRAIDLTPVAQPCGRPTA